MTVEETVGRVFGIDPLGVDDSTSPETVEEWDSMAHLTVVLEIEKQFSVSMSIEDTLQMRSVGKIKEVLRKYGARC